MVVYSDVKVGGSVKIGDIVLTVVAKSGKLARIKLESDNAFHIQNNPKPIAAK